MSLDDQLRELADQDRSGPWAMRIGGGALAVVALLLIVAGVLWDWLWTWL